MPRYTLPTLFTQCLTRFPRRECGAGRSVLPAGLAVLLLLSACAGGGAGGGRSSRADPLASLRDGSLTSGLTLAETLTIPVTGADGAVHPIQARLCRPFGSAQAPARLVVVNHGSPGAAEARARYRLTGCDSPPIRHFLARGYAVMAPLRRGYGTDTSFWPESYGRCDSPDYAGGGRETARDIGAAIAAARRLPGIRPDGVAVVGQSAGGWGVLALAAEPPEGVSALVAVAPGRGGRRNNRPNENCRPDRLAEDAGALGRGARLPVLWLHTPNDSFFGPALVAAMHRAFEAAGGTATLTLLPPWGQDGHAMFYERGGDANWGPAVDSWLAAHP